MSAVTPSPLTVVHVVGKGRSGSTLVDTLLGQLAGVESTGELRFLWEWGVEGGYRCGCGEVVVACPLWSAVLEGVTQAVPWAADPARARAVVDDVLRWPRVPALVRAARRGTRPSSVDRFASLYAAVYAAIAEVSDARVIVDSSKWPAHPALLGMVPGIRPVVVHLVRDPRGVANSYRAGKETRGDQPEMPRFGAVHSSISWDVRNLVAEYLPRTARGVPVHRLRYEDVVEDPVSSLQQVAALLGLDGTSLDFVERDAVTVRPTHTVGGNPGRFATGRIALRADTRWRAQLPARDRIVVEVLTSPLRQRYGYRRGAA